MIPDFGAMRDGMAEFLDLFRRQVEATELLAANTETIRQTIEAHYAPIEPGWPEGEGTVDDG